MKLVIFSIPNSLDIKDLQEQLNATFKRLGVVTKVTVLEESAFSHEEVPFNQSRLKSIFLDIIGMCGDPRNPKLGQELFLGNFWSIVFTTDKISKPILEFIAKEGNKLENVPILDDYGMRGLHSQICMYLRQTK